MGRVIQFKQAGPEQAAVRSSRSDRLDEFVLALAKNAKAISANKSAIEKDLRIIESIALSTQNPELRERLLGQTRSIHDQLLLAALGLQNAKRMMWFPKS
jgi:hypothetical protein